MSSFDGVVDHELKDLYNEAMIRVKKIDASVAKARESFFKSKSDLESAKLEYDIVTQQRLFKPDEPPDIKEQYLAKSLEHLQTMITMTYKIMELEDNNHKMEFSRMQELESKYFLQTMNIGEKKSRHSEEPMKSELQEQVHRMIIRAKNRKTKANSAPKRASQYDRQTKRHLSCHLLFQEYDLEELQLSLQDLKERINGVLPVDKAYGTFSSSAIVPLYNRYISIFDPSWSFQMHEEGDVLHVKREQHVPIDPKEPKEPSNTRIERQDAFVFNFGCLILWNFKDDEEEDEFASSVADFGRRPNVADIVDFSRETMSFRYGEASKIEYDEVSLLTDEYGERLAISFAFAQSCLLRMFEWRINSVIERNEKIPLKLMQEGKIDMSGTAISKELGRVFYERTMINLGQFMDVPEYFWGDQEWEPLYDSIKHYFDNQHRLVRLNQKLNQLKEIFDLLSAEADRLHGVHLEWIVIWLIVVEVCVDLIWDVFIKDILGFFKT